MVNRTLEKCEIAETVSRYFATLDEKQFDATTMGKLFTADAKVVRPNGAARVGPQDIGESHRDSMNRFRTTQHIASGFIITFGGDTQAEFRCNLVAMHVWAEGQGDPSVGPNNNYFLAGGVITGRAALEADGWKITAVGMEPAWRHGVGFEQVLETR